MFIHTAAAAVSSGSKRKQPDPEGHKRIALALIDNVFAAMKLNSAYVLMFSIISLTRLHHHIAPYSRWWCCVSAPCPYCTSLTRTTYVCMWFLTALPELISPWPWTPAPSCSVKPRPASRALKRRVWCSDSASTLLGYPHGSSSSGSLR